MKILNQLFRITKNEDKNLTGAAIVIVNLENQLTVKEAQADALRVSLDELYQAATLNPL